jgi:hypothetical protein
VEVFGGLGLRCVGYERKMEKMRERAVWCKVEVKWGRKKMT